MTGAPLVIFSLMNFLKDLYESETYFSIAKVLNLLHIPRVFFKNVLGPIVYYELALLVGFSRIIGAPVNLMTFPS